MGFDWIWFLSVWATGEAGRKVSCENAGWRREFEETLPDLCEDDIHLEQQGWRRESIRFHASAHRLCYRLRGIFQATVRFV